MARVAARARNSAAKRAGKIIAAARASGQKSLSEFDSKRILKAYGIPVTREYFAVNLAQARTAAKRLGFPVVLKACAADQAHKTEHGLVAVNITTGKELTETYRRLERRAGRNFVGGGGGFVVQEMVPGEREIMIGMVRDAQFGPSVMFGLGGIFTEILRDVVFRVAPVRKSDALAMVRGIQGHRILDGIRGMKPVDLEVLTKSIMALGRIGLDFDEIAEIDVNPLIVKGTKPVAVDALVVLGD